MIKIAFSSVFVDDQDKALSFYTDVLGFVKKSDIPVGQFRWLSVVSPDAPDGVELLLEPNDNPAEGVPSVHLRAGDTGDDVRRR